VGNSDTSLLRMNIRGMESFPSVLNNIKYLKTGFKNSFSESSSTTYVVTDLADSVFDGMRQAV
jgi:hypothetical protein